MKETAMTRIRNAKRGLLGLTFLLGCCMPMVRAQEPAAGEPGAPPPEQAAGAEQPVAGDGQLRLGLSTASVLWIGAEVAPADEPLRAQLGIPDGQGAVVTAVTEDSPAAQAGIQRHDVLLTVGDQPVANADDLQARLGGAGENAVTLRLLRSGKKLAIELTPKRNTLKVQLAPSDHSEVYARFWLGVGLATADDTLRSQLAVAAGEGLVVTSVEMHSPAWQAGMQIHDVLLTLDGKPLATIEGLQSQLQDIGARPASLELLRGGKPLTLDITPELHQDFTTFTNLILTRQPTVVEFFTPGLVSTEARLSGLVDNSLVVWEQTNAPQDDLQKQVSDLMQQFAQMQKPLESLDAAIKAKAQTPAQQPADPEKP
jgi:membrane-associated protease RseP (regulator of RpoE activity)